MKHEECCGSIQSLLYANKIVLIADTRKKLQLTLVEWKWPPCNGMIFNKSQSKVLVLSREIQNNVQLICNGKVLEVVQGIYLIVLK